MQATLNLRPRLFLTACSVSKVLIPIRSEASRKRTSSSSKNSRVGWSLRPTTMSASTPILLSSTARKLELRESPIIPVNGDFAATANLLDVVNLLPTSGLHAKTSGFSGPSGSAPGGQ